MAAVFRLSSALMLGVAFAFAPMGDKAMVMGDLVLLDREIKPVMEKLLDAGIAVSAVHNRLLRMSQPVFIPAIDRSEVESAE